MIPQPQTPEASIQEAANELERETRPAVQRGGRKACPYCGGTKWAESTEEYEEVYFPIQRTDGSIIPGVVPKETASETQTDEMGLPVVTVTEEPTRIPFYKPDIFPVILQKNVSMYGRFLGDSDIDKIADQQNTTNRVEAKIIDKLLKSGSYITLPDEASIRVDADDMKGIRPRRRHSSMSTICRAMCSKTSPIWHRSTKRRGRSLELRIPSRAAQTTLPRAARPRSSRRRSQPGVWNPSA